MHAQESSDWLSALIQSAAHVAACPNSDRANPLLAACLQPCMGSGGRSCVGDHQQSTTDDTDMPQWKVHSRMQSRPKGSMTDARLPACLPIALGCYSLLLCRLPKQSTAHDAQQAAP